MRWRLVLPAMRPFQSNPTDSLAAHSSVPTLTHCPNPMIVLATPFSCFCFCFHRPSMRVYEVASSYTMFSRDGVGKYLLQLCTSKELYLGWSWVLGQTFRKMRALARERRQ